ncbi:hypothetical protein [Spirosoma koreense]
MKTTSFFLDLRSFLLGALTLLGVGLLTNFAPAREHPAAQAINESRRYQAVTGAQGSIILDTQTGQYILVYGPGKGLRTKFDFNEMEPKAR